LKNWTDFLSEDPDKKKRSFFGKGPLIGTVGGPFVSDVITMGNVFGFYDLMSNNEMDERSIFGYLAGYQDYADKRDSDKIFDLVRTMNTQIGRSYFVTLPRMWDGASLGTLAQIEFGLYKSKTMQEKKMKYIYPIVEQFGVREPKHATAGKKKKKVIKKKDLLIESLQQLQNIARV
jgi:hypothetical protein